MARIGYARVSTLDQDLTVQRAVDADTMFGGQGQDTLFGDLGDDLLFGNLGEDLLFGNAGNDTLYGGQGNDTLYGGQGDDLLYGDLGDNTLYGDLGVDTAVFRGRRSDYTITRDAGDTFVLVGATGTTRASTIEFFRFDDGTVTAGDLIPATGGGGGGGSTPRNRAPTANPDMVTAVEAGGTANGTPGTNPIFNVITGGAGGAGADTDPNRGDTLTVASAAGTGTSVPVTSSGTDVDGAYGTLRIARDGSARYVVDNDDETVQGLRPGSPPLTDTFSYTVRDAGGLTSTTQVVVSIQGANDAPIANPDPDTYVEDSTTAVKGNVLTNDTDPDQRPGAEANLLQVAFSDDNANVATYEGTYGALTLNKDGSYVYSPNNQIEPVGAGPFKDSFSYTAIDQDGLIGSSTLTITITSVNDAPVFSSATSASTPENTLPTTVVYAARATDPEGNTPITFTLTGTDAKLFTIDPKTGDVQFKEAPNFENPEDEDEDNIYNITVEAADAGSPVATARREVAISVTDVNEAPVAQIDNKTTDASQLKNSQTTLINILANDQDPEDPTRNDLFVDEVFNVTARRGATSIDVERVASNNTDIIASYQIMNGGRIDVERDGRVIAVEGYKLGELSVSFNYVASDSAENLSRSAGVFLTFTDNSRLPVPNDNEYSFI